MELSQEIQNILHKYQTYGEKCDNNSVPSNENDGQISDDVIDVDEIDMNDDQNWLIESEVNSVEDLHLWLYDNTSSSPANQFSMIQEKSKMPSPSRKFDSRTFTRPKKKLNRPSIEKYNEDYFEGEKKLSDEIDNYMQTCKEDDEKPLHFDLSQPMSGSFFDKILSSAPELDSFANMSPPSLVNSMCSSTFTNLMESSYIRNDPVLREIRDADYSQEILQDTEVPMFQSFTESCSSINSDAPENFVRKTLIALNGTFNTNSSTDDYKTPRTPRETDDYIKSGDINDIHTENIDPNITINISPHTPSYGTYRKSNNSKLSTTFEKLVDEKLNSTFNKNADISDNLNDFDRKSLRIRDSLNSTFNKEYDEIDTNLTVNINRDDANINSYDSTFQKIPDNNEQNNLNGGTYRKSKINNFNEKYEKKLALRNNLDQTYDYSSNVKRENGGSQTLNDTIALEADHKSSRRLSDEIDEYLNEKMNSTYENERLKMNNITRSSGDSTDSLDRISSVSNSSRGSRQMMAEVDAIVEQQERSLQVMSTPKPAKSLQKLFESSYLSPIPNLAMKEHLSDSEISSEDYGSVRSAPTHRTEKVRSLSNLRNPKELQKPRSINTIGTNLKATSQQFLGSYSKSTDSKLRGSYSNLRTLNSNLKGSYTSLKPINRNLPNIPPKNLDATTIVNTHHQEVFKVPQVPTVPSANGTFLKPPNRISSLPRPVGSATGIPRPSSKIPAPKSVRSISARQIGRPSSKPNINDGFY